MISIDDMDMGDSGTSWKSIEKLCLDDVANGPYDQQAYQVLEAIYRTSGQQDKLKAIEHKRQCRLKKMEQSRRADLEKIECAKKKALPPLVPVKPVAAVSPIAHAAPAKPVAAVSPIAHAAPVKPVAAVSPIAHAAPVKPAAAVSPIAHVAPVTPVTPVSPVAQVGPVADDSKTMLIDVQAVGLLHQMLSIPASRLSAALVLEPIYRRQKNMEKLAEVLEVKLAERHGGQNRKDTFIQLIQIYEEQLQRPERAFMAACRAVRENADDNSLRYKLERLARETGSLEELVGVYEDIFEERGNKKIDLEVVRWLVRIKEELAHDPKGLIALWERVATRLPNDREALHALARLYRIQGDSLKLANTLLLLAKGEKNLEHKKDLYYEAAHLLEETPSKSHEAVKIYLQIVSEDPTETTAMNLVRMLQGRGMIKKVTAETVNGYSMA